MVGGDRTIMGGESFGEVDMIRNTMGSWMVWSPLSYCKNVRPYIYFILLLCWG